MQSHLRLNPIRRALEGHGIPTLVALLVCGCSDDGEIPPPPVADAGADAAESSGESASSLGSSATRDESTVNPSTVNPSTMNSSTVNPSGASSTSSGTGSASAAPSTSTDEITSGSSSVEAGTPGTEEATDDGGTTLDAPDAAELPLPPIDWTEPASGITCLDEDNCVSRVGAVNTDTSHTCVLKDDATVWCWGYQVNGEAESFELSDQPVPTQVPGLTNVASFSGTDLVSCAVKEDGTVWCWGAAVAPLFGPDAPIEGLPYDSYYTNYFTATPLQIPNLDHVKSVATGYGHVCALKDDGSVWCWGDNTWGQLGPTELPSSTEPVQVTGIGQARYITSGGAHVCILDVNGDVYCWGDNVVGELGDGQPLPEDYYAYSFSGTPTKVVGLGQVKAIDAQGAITCAVEAENDVSCWGALHRFELRETAVSVPTAIEGFAEVTQVSVGESYLCAVLTDGQISCVGFSENGVFGSLPSTSRDPSLVPGIENAVYVAAGGTHTCAVDETGQVLCWGSGISGELGNGEVLPYSRDEALPITSDDTFTAVVVDETACGVKTDRTLSCWGNNRYGQLGVDPTVKLLDSIPADIPGLSNVVDVRTASGNVCVVLDGGTVSCWGDNTYRQLGSSAFDGEYSTSPVEVEGLSGVVNVTVGSGFSCALLDGGTVSCWGNNDGYMIGQDPEEVPFSATPMVVPDLTDVVELATGVYHTCARRSDDSVVCWGRNFTKQFGAEVPNPTPPVVVESFSGVASIAAGSGYTCLLYGDGTVSCTSDEFPQEGVENVLTPIPELTNAASITPACALRNDGTIVCWTSEAQMPVGDAAAPALIDYSTLGAASALSSSTYFRSSCAVLADSSISCWGNNGSGVLGNGDLPFRLTPAPVIWPN